VQVAVEFALRDAMVPAARLHRAQLLDKIHRFSVE
jgi:hypothetical protein